jgi:hypothetical protein
MPLRSKRPAFCGRHSNFKNYPYIEKGDFAAAGAAGRPRQPAPSRRRTKRGLLPVKLPISLGVVLLSRLQRLLLRFGRALLGFLLQLGVFLRQFLLLPGVFRGFALIFRHAHLLSMQWHRARTS